MFWRSVCTAHVDYVLHRRYKNQTSVKMLNILYLSVASIHHSFLYKLEDEIVYVVISRSGRETV